MKKFLFKIINHPFKNTHLETRRMQGKQSSIIHQSKGFTLIELLVAIAIIGILSSFLISGFVGTRQRARDAERKSDLRQLQVALEYYKADIGTYPTPPLPTCNQPLQSATTVYMKQIPCDPLNKSDTYFYFPSCVAGDCRTYQLWACLENDKDLEKDSSTKAGCPAGTVSFTIKNPS